MVWLTLFVWRYKTHVEELLTESLKTAADSLRGYLNIRVCRCWTAAWTDKFSLWLFTKLSKTEQIQIYEAVILMGNSWFCFQVYCFDFRYPITLNFAWKAGSELRFHHLHVKRNRSKFWNSLHGKSVVLLDRINVRHNCDVIRSGRGCCLLQKPSLFPRHQSNSRVHGLPGKTLCKQAWVYVDTRVSRRSLLLGGWRGWVGAVYVFRRAGGFSLSILTRLLVMTGTVSLC